MDDRRESYQVKTGRTQARRDNIADGVQRDEVYLPDSDEDYGYQAEWAIINQEIEQSSELSDWANSEMGLEIDCGFK